MCNSNSLLLGWPQVAPYCDGLRQWLCIVTAPLPKVALSTPPQTLPGIPHPLIEKAGIRAASESSNTHEETGATSKSCISLTKLGWASLFPPIP